MKLASILVILATCKIGISAEPVVATYSIVAIDSNTGELGVAVQSKFPAVGSVVPWAEAGVGAIATQAFANTGYGPEGLRLLKLGKSPNEVIELLTGDDPFAERRQVGIVDAHGNSATFTGHKCSVVAGGKRGKNYAVQGNILVNADVVDAIAEAFEQSTGELGSRLIDALEAGQAAGGERRGMQAAALLIVRESWGYARQNDRYRDIRVDDHPSPIKELRRVYEIHKKLFPAPIDQK